MKRITWMLVISLLSIFLFIGCGKTTQSKEVDPVKTLTAEQAKSKLEKDYGVPFNADNFISMIKSNEIEKVKLFLQAGIDPNTRYMKDSSDRYYYGKPALMIATMLGEEDIVKILLEDSRININALDNSQCNVLWRVSDSGKGALVKSLVEKGANVNYFEPKDGNDPLSYAVYKNQKEVVKALVENGANIKRLSPKYKTSILDVAVICKSGEDMFKTLIQLGADVNAVDGDGCTPLYGALLESNNLEMIKVLVDNGANVNFMRKNTSCLLVAKNNISRDKQKIVDYLIAHGAK